MQKRYIVIHVTEDFKKNNEGLSGFVFPYNECDIQAKRFGGKTMFLVYKTESNESLLLIDSDKVEAIEYDRYLEI